MNVALSDPLNAGFVIGPGSGREPQALGHEWRRHVRRTARVGPRAGGEPGVHTCSSGYSSMRIRWQDGLSVFVLDGPEPDGRSGFGLLDRADTARGDDANPAAGRGDDPDDAAGNLASDDSLCLRGDGPRPEGLPTGSLRIPASSPPPFFAQKKKPTWWNTPKVFDHVGLLVNEPPGQPGCPSPSRPTTSGQVSSEPSLNAISAPLHHIIIPARTGKASEVFAVASYHESSMVRGPSIRARSSFGADRACGSRWRHRTRWRSP